MANLTNMVLDKLEAAGVVLVPFDSSNLDQAIAVSWGGGPESIGFELPDALSRYDCHMNMHMSYAYACSGLPIHNITINTQRHCQYNTALARHYSTVDTS